MNSTPDIDPLTRVAQGLEALMPADAPSAWIEVMGNLTDPDDARWHFDDVSIIVGMLAPPECAALASIGRGWAFPLEEQGSPGLLGPGEKRRCLGVYVLTRRGEAAGYVRCGRSLLVEEAPSAGRIPDLIHRAFGLATPPPEESTAGLLARIWLREVIASAKDRPKPLAWAEVTARHPVVKVMREAGLQVPPAELVEFLDTASQTWDWATIRKLACCPGWFDELLTPEGAAWMDEGILSRWMLTALPEPERLLQLARPLMTSAAARKLDVVLRRIEVIPSHHPGWLRASNT